MEDVFRENQKEGLNVDVFFQSIPLPAVANTPHLSAITEMTQEEVERMLIGQQTVDETYASWDARRKDILAGN
jgi:ABC-type glycerol-3-phosphate transport system substrate-binding protein